MGFYFIMRLGDSMNTYPVNIVNEYLRHSNLKVNRHGYAIADIFRDYWSGFLLDHPQLNIRPVVYENVERMMKCKTPDLGYSFFSCPNCDNFMIVYNSCKSRFCNSCGVKYAKQRAVHTANVLMDCGHRHITFTIPDSLRIYFRQDRSRLNLLFEAVNQTLQYLSLKHGKSKRWKLGYVLVCHTFGRALNFNCHIHALVSEGMINKSGDFKPLVYFNFELLRKSFMKTLLDLLHQELGRGFYKEKCVLYTEKENGFYVHGPSSDAKSQKGLIEYVLRYTGRPVMAESRIDEVDHVNRQITYTYEPHEDDLLPDEKKSGTVIVTEDIYEFIKKLIVHIPERQFKMIRYYGVYASKGRRLIPNYKKKKCFKSLFPLRWKNLILQTFKFDPLLCPCGATMKYEVESSHYP